jgi:hypothetical protein
MCCHGNATMCFLQYSRWPKNISLYTHTHIYTSSPILTVLYHFTGTKWFYGKFMTPATTLLNHVSICNTKHFCPIVTKSEFSWQILSKVSNFIRICPVGAELIHVRRRMDRHNKANRFPWLMQTCLIDQTTSMLQLVKANICLTPFLIHNDLKHVTHYSASIFMIYKPHGCHMMG